MTTVAVILAGGTGTRLYPASRSHRPKQFQSFVGDDSLIRQAADRAAFADEIVVVTREAYVERVEEHVPEATVLIEPTPKNTGPALVYAAHFVDENYDDPVIVALPSDHVIGSGFAETARRAVSAAVETDGLVTIGIDPNRPATEYGYIQPDSAANGYAPVIQFREKPDESTAREFVDAGYRWNAGIFAWRPAAFLAEAASSELATLVDALDDGDEVQGFEDVDDVSVDYGVLEAAADVYMVPADFAWDDLGSWDALERLLDGDNATLGDALTIDADGNVIASDDHHVSVVGVDDLVVAAFDDRVLVVPKAEAQRVREVVAVLREQDAF